MKSGSRLSTFDFRLAYENRSLNVETARTIFRHNSAREIWLSTLDFRLAYENRSLNVEISKTIFRH